MKSQDLAHALFEKVKESPEKTREYFSNFKRLLKEKKKINARREIIKELGRLVASEERKRTVNVSVAKKSDDVLLKRSIRELGDSLAVPNNFRLRVNYNPKLIGGIRIKTFEKLLDTTYKKKLLELYDKILSNT